MRVVSAYLLAVLGGNSSPAEADIQKILSSVGVEAEAGRIATLLKEMEGKSLDEILAEGRTKLSSVGSGGGGGGGAAPAAAAAAGGAAPAAAAAKVEEKPESDEDMGFSLFD